MWHVIQCLAWCLGLQEQGCGCGRKALFKATRTAKADMVKELIDRADDKMTALDVAMQAMANCVESVTSVLAALTTSKS